MISIIINIILIAFWITKSKHKQQHMKGYHHEPLSGKVVSLIYLIFQDSSLVSRLVTLNRQDWRLEIQFMISFLDSFGNWLDRGRRWSSYIEEAVTRNHFVPESGLCDTLILTCFPLLPVCAVCPDSCFSKVQLNRKRILRHAHKLTVNSKQILLFFKTFTIMLWLWQERFRILEWLYCQTMQGDALTIQALTTQADRITRRCSIQIRTQGLCCYFFML